MTEDELIEKMAKAIYEASGYAYDGRTVGSKGPYGEWGKAIKQARAALKVCRRMARRGVDSHALRLPSER